MAVITGTAASETLTGTTSADFIEGFAGNDTLVGDAGDDALLGDVGADRLDGGDGFGVADYRNATTGLNVSLANAASNPGDAAGDTYVSIEWLHGSDFNDTLVGDGGDNYLNGGLGADSLVGGAGEDVADYSDAAGLVTADLGNLSNNSGDATGDTYNSIEGLSGSAFSDVLAGDA